MSQQFLGLEMLMLVVACQIYTKPFSTTPCALEDGTLRILLLSYLDCQFPDTSRFMCLNGRTYAICYNSNKTWHYLGQKNNGRNIEKFVNSRWRKRLPEWTLTISCMQLDGKQHHGLKRAPWKKIQIYRWQPGIRLWTSWIRDGFEISKWRCEIGSWILQIWN